MGTKWGLNGDQVGTKWDQGGSSGDQLLSLEPQCAKIVKHSPRTEAPLEAEGEPRAGVRCVVGIWLFLPHVRIINHKELDDGLKTTSILNLHGR